MKLRNLFKSWELYVIIICVGFALWAIPELFDLIRPRPTLKALNKSIPYLMIEPKTIYTEVKDWAKVIGQILTGIGGVGGAVKIMADLFNRTRKR